MATKQQHQPKAATAAPVRATPAPPSVTVVPPAGLLPVSGQDGSLWYSSVDADGTKVGLDAATYRAAYKRPGGPVAAFPSPPGVTYSYANAGSGDGRWAVGQSYAGGQAAAARWDAAAGTAERLDPVRVGGAWSAFGECVGSDGLAVVNAFGSRYVWRADGTVAPLDLSAVLPGVYVWGVYAVEPDGDGTHALTCSGVGPAGWVGYKLGGVAL